MDNITLPYNYTPRWYQKPFFKALEQGYRRHDLVWHRRAGKDLTIINATAAAMCDSDNQTGYGGVGSYYYFFPTFAQGKKVIWDGMTRDGIKFTDFILGAFKDLHPSQQPKVWNDEMKIQMPNGSLFQIIGTDNFDAVMGTNPIWCVFSEYALQNPKAWDYIRPILRENKGIAIFPYTPRGRNHGYTLHYDVAQKNPDTWFSQVLPVNVTKVLTEEDVEQERKDGMSEEMIAQEFYCSFEMGIEGSYYARQVQDVRDEGRILSTLPVDKAKPVHTAWDIGVTDFTSIIFYQVYPQGYHIVDFYENMGEGVQHYAKVLQEKGYTYGNHYGPHDLKAVNWVSEGEPTIQVARRYGINFILVPRLSRADGIEAGRNVLSRCYFNEATTRPLITHLENYTKVFNKQMNCYTDTPKHDIHSHAADAWRYFAVAEKNPETPNYFKTYEEEIEELKARCNPYSGL